MEKLFAGSFALSVFAVGIGIIVCFVVAKIIMSSFNNTKYSKAVEKANEEILNSARVSVPEGIMPESYALDYLITSIAHKHGIRPQEMYTPMQIYDILRAEMNESETTKVEGRIEEEVQI